MNPLHGRKPWLRPPGPIAPGMRIGLLGGSFNPAHEGHLHVSRVALKSLGLDYVWWLVTPQNPLKPGAAQCPLAARVAHARTIARHPRFVVMDIEHTLHTHYSIDTVKALQRRFPAVRFVWLMGSDNLANFRCWHRWPELAARIPIAVIQRPGTVLACLSASAMLRFARRRRIRSSIVGARPPAIAILDGVRSAQSSTAIRAGWAQEALVSAIAPC